MNRRFWAALILAMPLPALAQDQATCQDMWRSIRGAIPQDTSSPAMPQIVRSEDGWCVINGVAQSVDGTTRIEIGQLRWQGVGLAAFLDNQTPPTALSIRAENLRVIPTPGDPVLDYLLRAQAQPNNIQASFGANWEADKNRLNLIGLTLDFPGENSVRVSGALDRIDLSSRDAMLLSLGGAALSNLQVQIVSNGLFENTVLMALGGSLLNRDDPPEDQVSELQAQAVGWINGLPDSLTDEASKAALVRFVNDIPNPKGAMTLELSAPDGFVLARLMRFGVVSPPETPDELAAALDGLRIGFFYD